MNNAIGLRKMLVVFIQHLINGLSLGSIYALISLGYTLVFGVLQLINFAHGDVYMLGAFVGYYTSRYFGLGQESSISSLLFVLFVSMAFCSGIGFLIERFAYRPLRKAPRINVLITAIGVSMLLEFSGQLIFGSDPKFFPELYRPSDSFTLGELKVNPIQLIIFFISLAFTLALHFLIFKTRIGRAMRAVSFNHDFASLMGIPVNRMISLTFMLSAALAGGAGVLVGLSYPKLDPLMGIMPGLKSFVAAVLGGIGNVKGAILGAITLGLAEEFLVGYWSPNFKEALAFAILILILLIKPTGLLGTKTQDKV